MLVELSSGTKAYKAVSESKDVGSRDVGQLTEIYL